MFATNVVIMIISGIEMAWLCALHGRGLVQWEPIWVIAISWLAYASDLIKPDSEWVKPTLDNGEYVDWLKLVGWMATCPVLILFLVLAALLTTALTATGLKPANAHLLGFRPAAMDSSRWDRTPETSAASAPIATAALHSTS